MRTRVVGLQSLLLVIFSAEGLEDGGTSAMSALDPAFKGGDKCVLSLPRIYASSEACVGCCTLSSATTC